MTSAVTMNPRNPLPTSPIKIRAGGQFHTKHPRLAADSLNIAAVIPESPPLRQLSHAAAAETKIDSLPAIPSIPSIKLNRFVPQAKTSTANTEPTQNSLKPHLANSLSGKPPTRAMTNTAATKCTLNRDLAVS